MLIFCIALVSLGGVVGLYGLGVLTRMGFDPDFDGLSKWLWQR
jgi:hypothetical protein